MNFEELKSFFQKNLRWGRLSERDFRIDEIDENSVRSFLRTARAKGRLSVFNGDEPIEEIFEKKGIWNNPLEATREAIANALLHRDYLRPINVQIKVYDDKIWFYNVGGLPEEWDTEKLLSSHSSMPRNPTIFNIFYLVGIVESVGSGIERMINALKAAGLPEPKIKQATWILHFCL